MKTHNVKLKTALALALSGMLAIGPATAAKPSWAGGGKPDRDEHMDKGGSQKGERHETNTNSPRGEGRRDHFEDRHRVAVRDFYVEQYRGGHCPPGLAKKHNGCMPPGQAKKWQIGYQLPRDVVYYSVPQGLVVQIGLPPSGYRYVRVASDILLMAIGTGMIVDAIQDLGRS
jgi:Ni/Co efflux regulator RcnB